MTDSSPPRRKIVLIGPVSPHRGGVAQHTAQLADALGETGDEVTVESWKKQYPSLLYRRAERDPNAAAHQAARFDLRWFDPLSWIRVARRNRKSDVLVIQWVTPFNVAAIVLIRALMGAHRTVAIVHNAIPHESFPLVGPLSRLALRDLDQVVCHARSIIDDLHALDIHTDSEAVIDHPPNVDIEPTPLPPQPPLKLLFLGYLRRYKGADIAVASIADLQRRRPDLRLHLTVAGEAWSPEDRVNEQVTTDCLDDDVTIIDEYLSDDQMVQLIADHHLLVAPYRSATQSGVISLALAGGRAVVATDVGGLAEVVRHGINGICCPPEDVELFSNAIIEAIGNLSALTKGAADHAVGWQEVTHLIVP